MAHASGNVTVAPRVLARLVLMAVREVPGVARMGSAPRAHPLGTVTHSGVAVRISDEGASVDCYIVAMPDTNLLELGTAVQATIGAVIQDLAGLTAREVNVYIQDVGSGYG